MLSDEQIERYSRQIILPQIGGRGQEALLAATVVLRGDGSLIEAACLYLAAAGVGRLLLVDVDGGERLADSLTQLNPDCRSLARPAVDDRRTLVGEASVVIESPPDRRGAVFNDACATLRRPLVWGTSRNGIGLVSVLCHGDATPCLACLQLDSTTQADQVERVMFSDLAAGFVGTQQATETIKIIVGLESSLAGRLLTFDVLADTVHDTPVARDPACVVCSSGTVTRGAEPG
jgi:molybdopterin/thiamine biosynthesis adenylyltransferase